MTTTDPSSLLRRTVADFFEVDESRVGPGFSLQTRQGSIARAALDAAIRARVGVKSAAVYSARTFGELAAEVAPGSNGLDSAAPAQPAVAAPAVSSPVGLVEPGQGVACGVDMELVANLPVAIDPWEDTFYRANFSESEIAYCLRQGEPSVHFAARWCAKEALKKCDQAFLAVEPCEVEVVHDEAGVPRLNYLGGGSARRLPHALSLSHTTLAAIAVVVRADVPPPSSGPVASELLVASSSAAALSQAPSPPGRIPRGFLLLNLLTILVAGLSLIFQLTALRSFFSR